MGDFPINQLMLRIFSPQIRCCFSFWNPVVSASSSAASRASFGARRYHRWETVFFGNRKSPWDPWDHMGRLHIYLYMKGQFFMVNVGKYINFPMDPMGMYPGNHRNGTIFLGQNRIAGFRGFKLRVKLTATLLFFRVR